MGTRQNRLAEAVLTHTHNLCFEQEYQNYQSFLSDLFFLCKIFNIFEKACFRNALSNFMTIHNCWLKIKPSFLASLLSLNKTIKTNKNQN